MAIRSRAELLELINARIGDDTSDEALAIIEDLTDTLDDYETRIADSGDWRARYEQNDAEWRERYKARFFAGTDKDDIDLSDDINNDKDEEIEVKTYDELFEEVK